MCVCVCLGYVYIYSSLYKQKNCIDAKLLIRL